MHIIKLTLTCFRNLESLTISVPDAALFAAEKKGQLVALIGENGVGKTSVLEALSLLAPGRGLHKAVPEEMVKRGAPQWGIFAALSGMKGDSCGVGQAFERPKKGKGARQLKIDGVEGCRQSQLATLGHVMWLTPRQDRLFLDGAAVRRDFLDRLVYGLLPDHAEVLSRYKYHVGNRLRLLKQGADADWIALEEQQAAAAGVAVLQNRLAYLKQLASVLQDVRLTLTGATLAIFEEEDPVLALAGKFERSRARDAEVGATHTGAQKVDLLGILVFEDGYEVALGQASSGQHKRGLIQIVLAHARLMREVQGMAPLVLMDEVAAHLDAGKRSLLLSELTGLGAQVWVTETELERLGDVVPDLVVHMGADALL